MGTSNELLLRMACCGAFLAMGGVSLAAGQQTAVVDSASPQQKPVIVAELPDSPGAAVLKSQQAPPPQSASSQAASAPGSIAIEAQAVDPQKANSQAPDSSLTEPQTQPAPPSQTPSSQEALPATHKPVGTAAAGAISASGIAASQPSGVAIAPAKQHRVRSIVLKMGAIVGAGVAVGSVVALTEATPSRPPGAH